MKILILEDAQERIEFFNRVYKNHTLFITDSLNYAQNLVKYKGIEFDIMFLDHDITTNDLIAIKEENTGYDFVKFLVADNLQKQSIIYIHSMNPVGANKMLNLLKDNDYKAEWFPFHLMKESE